MGLLRLRNRQSLLILTKKEMNNMKTPAFNIRWYIPVVIIFTMVLAGCNHHRNDPGYAYMAEFDMYYSVPYDAYTSNPVFSDSLTMQTPPVGTVARGQIPYPYQAKSMDEQVRAGQELVNPIEATPEAIAKGKEQYQVA